MKFIPSKKEYLNFIFEFNTEIIEGLHPKESVTLHYDELEKRIVDHLQYDIQRARKSYFGKSNALTGLYVPPLNQIRRMANEVIRYERKNKN